MEKKSFLNSSDRIIWIDAVKAVCIFFVVLSHFSKVLYSEILFRLYSPIYLSGFLFVSGYTYKHRNSFYEHFRKKTLQLFIPWMLFSVGNILVSRIVTFNPEKHTDIIMEIIRNFLQIRGYGDGMWFVSALFIAYIPFFYVINICKKTKHPIRVMAILSIAFNYIYILYITKMPDTVFVWKSKYLPWHIEYIPYALSFMIIGYIYKEKLERIIEKKDDHNLLILLLMYITCIYIKYECIKNINTAILIFDYLLSVCGLLILIQICKKIIWNDLTKYIGRNTLIYFGIHGKLLSLWEKIITIKFSSIYNLIISNQLLIVFYTVIATSCLLIIMVVPSVIINTYFPFMVGRGYSKTD